MNKKQVYESTRDGITYCKEFAISDNGHIDCLKHSLYDFIQGQELDNLSIGDRLEMVTSIREDAISRKYYLYRRTSLTGSGPVMSIIDPYTNQEKDMINMASNDYLNLTKHPRVIEAGICAIKKYGAGAGSVPLLAGTINIHRELENKIAAFKGCESAILFTSGFGSNVAVLSTLLRKNDVAILDTLVHASIADGCKNTNIMFFRHNDMESLEKVLKRAAKKYVNRIVVVDGVYSMDGDIAPLKRIIELAHVNNAFVMVDEAHATGVIGKTGKGTPEYWNIEGKVDIVAGTFSKALGGVGGFVASSRALIKYLELLARPFMFSTAPAPAVTASLIEALNVIGTEPKLHEKLWWNINYFKKHLLEAGFNIGNAETAIFPIIISDTEKTYEMGKRLHEMGIYANTVVFPAVPVKLSRIRISLTSGLDKNNLDIVLEALKKTGRELNII